MHDNGSIGRLLRALMVPAHGLQFFVLVLHVSHLVVEQTVTILLGDCVLDGVHVTAVFRMGLRLGLVEVHTFVIDQFNFMIVIICLSYT